MTTVTAHSTPPALVVYLRRATWGLSAARRQELWDELEEHVLERADHLCAFGTPYELALQRAVSELGPPARVSAGMSEVYLMPNMIRAGLIATLTGTLAVMAVSGDLRSVPVLSERPVRLTCAVSQTPMVSNRAIKVVSHAGTRYCYIFLSPSTAYKGIYVELQALSAVLSSQGLTLTGGGSAGKSWFFSSHLNGKDKTVAFTESFTQNKKSYVDVSMLVDSLVRTGTPLNITGFDRPVVQFGKVKFAVGGPQAQAAAAPFWSSQMFNTVTSLFPSAFNTGVGISGRSQGMVQKGQAHRIKVADSAGVVYGMIYRDERGLLTYDFNAVNAQGQLDFESSRARIAFVSSAREVTPYLKGGRAQALLIRFSGKVLPKTGAEFKIVQPLSPTSDAE